MRIFIIDDDEIFVFLTKKTILSASNSAEVISFCEAESALEFIKAHIESHDLLPDYVLLDLSMPVMDGWAFLEEYAKITPLKKGNTRLYILSSSISPHDIEKVKKNELVCDFLIKPLTKETVTSLLSFTDTNIK